MSTVHVKVSKFLSLVLRHQPEAIGLTLDPNGWADVDELIRLANATGHRLTRELVDAVVAQNDKKRFAFSEDGRRIRASQGHSVAVDLDLPPADPPGSSLPRHRDPFPRFHSRVRAPLRQLAARASVCGCAHGHERRPASRQTGGARRECPRDGLCGAHVLSLSQRRLAHRVRPLAVPGVPGVLKEM